MKYKIFQANSIVWLICLIIELFFQKGSFIHEAASGMMSVNMFVFLYFAGWVVNDYLKKNYSEDETLEN
jgi:hypothetical protein